MLHRIFIAINLPESVKTELFSYQKKWPGLPARWIKPENMHITLVFYGNASDKEVEEIATTAKDIAKKHKTFTLKLSNIVYGPTTSQPRMLWAAGETSKELLSLQKDLGTALGRLEKREFSLHLTLARFREWEFQRMEAAERPEVNEEISLEIPVHSIEIMESTLKRGGAEYTICESISLV